MSSDQIAHDITIAIIINRKIDTPAQATEKYQIMYKDILHRLSK